MICNFLHERTKFFRIFHYITGGNIISLDGMIEKALKFVVTDDPVNGAGMAFFMPNKPLKTSEMPKYIVPIRDIEVITGLDFLSVLDKETQDNIETKKPGGLWN